MRRRMAGTLLALSLTLIPAMTGCGGSDEGDGVATAGGGTGAQAAASAETELSDSDRQIKFTECMRENGVDLPDPESGGGMKFRIGGNVDQQKVQAAMEKCRSYLPNGGERPQLDGEQAEQIRQMAQCMRENGVPDFPDPDADGRIKIDSRMLRMNPDDPTMKAAMEKCREHAPTFGGGTRVGGGGTR